MDVFRLSVNGLVPVAGLVQNVSHWRLNTAGTHTDYELAQDLALAFSLADQTDMLEAIAQNCTLESYSAERVQPNGGPTATVPVNLPGLFTADCNDTALAVNTRLLPGAPPYRRKEGHWYFWGVPVNGLVDNVWDPAYLALIQTFNIDLLNGLPSGLEPGNGWTLIIYDKTTHTGPDVANAPIVPAPSHLRKRQRPYPV